MKYEIEKTLWSKCEICNKELSEIKKEIGGTNIYFSTAFKKHIEKEHQINLKDYFTKNKNITFPKCECGICNKYVDLKIRGAKIFIRRYACGRNEGVKKWSKEAKQTRKGKNNPMFGKRPWNKDKTKSTCNELKIVSEKLTGRVVSEGTKLKQSISAKKRKIHGNSGNRHSEISKQKMREATLKRISNGDFKHLKSKPHILFKNILTKLKIDFEEEVVFGFFCIDFFLKKYNIYIEVDGDYFHTNPKIFKNGPLTKTQKINWANDKRKDAFFKNKKIKLVRFWEFDILNNEKDIECHLKKLIASKE